MTPPAAPERYKNHRFPGEIISHGVWLYYRFPLSYRDVQELLFERGIDVTHEAIRQWCLKFGQDYANQLKRRRPRPGDKWHLDEVFLTINGERHYLWRAVDQDDNVLDILVELINRYFDGNVDLMDLHGVALGSPRADVLCIANRTGVWRSRDRGDTWENLHLETFSPIAYSRGVQTAPNDPNTFYACVGKDFGSTQGGVLRSTDVGDTWERFDRGVAPDSTTFGVAVNARHPEQVYFCTRRGQVFGTYDDGATWSEHRLPGSAMNVMSIACTN